MQTKWLSKGGNRGQLIIQTKQRRGVDKRFIASIDQFDRHLRVTLSLSLSRCIEEKEGDVERTFPSWSE